MHLTIDPGTKAMGWALWDENKMTLCGLARGKTWTSAVTAMPKLKVDKLIIEDQQIYRTSRIDAHSLLAVARVVGAAVAYYDFCPHLLVKPREWKGQLTKEICNQRTLARLTEEERSLISAALCPPSLKHNVLDAIGIGLWAIRKRRWC